MVYGHTDDPVNLVLILVGVVAWMPGTFVGNPLYCFPQGEQVYSTEEAWAIVPIQSDIPCGSWVTIDFQDGRTLLLPVWDKSELHVTPSALGLPFVIELPEHLYVGQEVVTVKVYRP